MRDSEKLLNRVREALQEHHNVNEKAMFGGVCFMVDDKMCVCVRNSGLLCRIGQKQTAVELEKDHCSQMMSGGRVMKDFVYVEPEQIETYKGLQYWINLCLEFNPLAKASK